MRAGSLLDEISFFELTEIVNANYVFDILLKPNRWQYRFQSNCSF